MPVETNRRQLLCGLAASVPLATILADPKLARAAAEGLQDVTITTAGGRSVSGALALPEAAKAPAVLMIHEWWGLNDQIKTMAAELARNGYVVLAADLYRGRTATTRPDAGGLMQAVDQAEATDTLVSWADWLRRDARTTGKVGTIGWCFGGGWSLKTSIATPVEATVIYYGDVRQPVDQLEKLKGPVLGHFATQDVWVSRDMVALFEQNMKAANRPLTVYWYEAEHAFANPTYGPYNAEDAKLAWERTLEFYRQNLKG